MNKAQLKQLIKEELANNIRSAIKSLKDLGYQS